MTRLDLVTIKTYSTPAAELKELKALAFKASTWIVGEQGAVSAQGDWTGGDWHLFWERDNSMATFLASYADRRPAVVMQYAAWEAD